MDVIYYLPNKGLYNDDPFSDNVQFQFAFSDKNSFQAARALIWCSEKFGQQRWSRVKHDITNEWCYINESNRWAAISHNMSYYIGFINESDYMEFMLAWG